MREPRSSRLRRFRTAALLLAAVGVMTCAGLNGRGRPSGGSSDFVASRDGHLFLGERRFRFVGVNVYSLASAPEDSDGYSCGTRWSDDDLETLFTEVAAMGGTVIRFDAYQAFTDGGRDFSRIDRIMALANAHGVRVIPTLENQWSDCTEGGYKYADWYRDGYMRPYGAYRLSYREYARRIVRRYRDEPAILMWQLMNEAESRTVHGLDDPESLIAFAMDMSSLVHHVDGNHLLSLGTIGVGRPGSGGAFYALLHQIPGIDVVEAHDYHADEQAMPRDIWLSLLVARAVRRPFFIGEVGISAPPSGREERAAMIAEKLEAAWSADADGVLIWSYRAGDGGNKDFDADDPLYGAIRRFVRTHPR